jgi:trehalose synthase
MARMRARLQPIPVAARDLAAYEGLVPENQLDRARELGRRLAGLRVLYLSPAPLEAGDPSPSLAALLQGLGLEAQRAVLHGDREFASVSGDVADAIRGADWALTPGDWQALREACEAAAVGFDTRPFDVVSVQGAAAAPLIEGRRGGGAWLWRTGVDAGEPAREAAEAVLALLGDYRQLSFALPGFVPAGLGGTRLRVVPGAFDPRGGDPPARGPWPRCIDPARPLLCHIGRLDSWADPLAAVEVWKLARREAPGLQLAIAGRVDPSDPEAAGVLEEVRAFAGDDEDLHLVTDRNGAGPGTIEAVATLARCAMRCSVGEQFDPEVAASVWRGTPVVGGGDSIAAQVIDGAGGFVADDPVPQAVRVAALVNGPRRALQVARAGRDRVLERFSIVRLLGDELESLGQLLAGGRSSPGVERSRGGGHRVEAAA